MPEAKCEACEACGTIGPTKYVFVYTTNGGLRLCAQCLAEINGKNPELVALRKEHGRVLAQNAALVARVRELEAALTAPTWLVWSNEHAAWWGPNQRGYYFSISAAGRYTLEEALEICTMRGVERGDGINPPELIQPSPEWLAARTGAISKAKEVM